MMRLKTAINRSLGKNFQVSKCALIRCKQRRFGASTTTFPKLAKGRGIDTIFDKTLTQDI
jgi:hypothetical protein